ncbi:MAG TPA: lysophospholipid acyltransferase family protein [Lentimicrobium sp.]|nr:lysophospholipid acyltransferase family protein [Lentimicrobium sp.]
MVNRSLSSFLFITARLISYLPFNWLYVLSNLIAWILRKVVGYRRSVIIQNLSRSFPDLKYSEIKNIADKFYLHFSDVFIEVLKSISLPGTTLRKRFKVENPELVLQYYKDGNNIIGLTGHIANWEWMSIIPSLYPFPCFTLYKPLRSKMAEHIMTRVRHRFGMKLLAMSNAARYILGHKNDKALYIFIGDQSPAKNENAEEFNFLNQKTTFFTGGAKLAKATNAKVVYISIRKVNRGYYNVKFLPLSASDKNEYNSILEQYSTFLQEDIVNNPVDWLWSHKRWKH